MLKQILTLTLFINTFLYFNLFNIPTAQAAYTPPPNQKKPPSNASFGSATTRGCDGNSLSIIIASGNRVGQTISTHPTFVWFIDDNQPRQMEFIVYEHIQDNQYKKVYQTTKTTTSGIMSFTLPNEENPLTPNKIYVSQVTIFCEPNSPSTALSDLVYFEVVNVSSTLTNQLANVSNSLAKVNIYAESGLWFDAMKEAINLSPSGELGEVGVNLLQELIPYEKETINGDSDLLRIERLEQFLLNN
ncbi:DUF928 domain-containing protein [Crocosphaera sp. Alani8]|uniref:DUF928 domain-containing protein n=1 Tax=Crocosphaera sp. Alani8 TaxID=3038952 RepID=UPI00313DB59A